MRGKSSVLVVVAVLLAAAADISAQPAKWKGKVVEENGGRVVINPAQPMSGNLIMKLKEELTIGAGPDEQSVFKEGIDVAADADGAIYILDQKECRIQVFDKNGKYVLTIGRKGPGPGELIGPAGVFLLGPKSLYSQDATRINVFGKDGQWLKSTELSVGLGGSGYYALAASGTSLAILSSRKPNGNWILEAVSHDANGKKIKTVLQGIDTSETYSTQEVILNLDPDRLWIAPWPGGLAVCGMNRTYDLHVLGDNGGTAFIIRKEDKPIAYAEMERKSRTEDARKYYEQARGQSRGKALRLTRTYSLPLYRPYFKSFLVDDIGRIYVVRDYEGADIFKGLEFDLFDAEGYCLYRLKLPAMILPASIVGDKIYAKGMDKKTGRWCVKRHRIVNYAKIKSALK